MNHIVAARTFDAGHVVVVVVVVVGSVVTVDFTIRPFAETRFFDVTTISAVLILVLLFGPFPAFCLVLLLVLSMLFLRDMLRDGPFRDLLFRDTASIATRNLNISENSGLGRSRKRQVRKNSRIYLTPAPSTVEITSSGSVPVTLTA